MAQSLNMRDNGLKVMIGLRKGGHSWKAALKDGWIEGQTLFPIEEACKKGTIIMNLLSDAGQKDAWPMMKPYLTAGKTLYFSHGFGIVYNDQTKIDPPKDIDIILAAPVWLYFLKDRFLTVIERVRCDCPLSFPRRPWD